MLVSMAQRMPNFTLEQKLYLIQRIQGVVDTVQDFRKDTNTTVQRNAVWEQLVQAFNAAFPDRPPSTTGTLKTLWKRLKVECRAALHRRQEQQAAGLPLTSLTQVQREVMVLVPNLISNQEDPDGDCGYASLRTGSPLPVPGATGTSSSEQEDTEHPPNDEVDSKEQVAAKLGLSASTESLDSGKPTGPASSLPSVQFRSHSVTSTSSVPRTVPLYINQTGISSQGFAQEPQRRAPARARHSVLGEDSWPDGRAPEPHGSDPRRQERYALEHEQTMRLLLLQQTVWEEKRKAARQKEKAARAKKRYYQAKLKRMGAEVRPSSSDSED
ncbi:fibrinogen silencer-binding protein [Chanos chanos]|uniref:Fibrinogen silencer-binding protein n=1 Tax=Chanos chanos TaxID=29144 RepID=A0A6J2W1V9_CHACN|nr:fibrinogen silencer-binding protein-like [Chanos chanos]